MRKPQFLASALLLLAVSTQAQHRFVGGSDTWMGSIVAVNDQTREITLKAAFSNETQTFTGVLKTGLRVRRRDGSETTLQMSELSLGSTEAAYYARKTRKVGGKKEKYFEIYRLDPVYIFHHEPIREQRP